MRYAARRSLWIRTVLATCLTLLVAGFGLAQTVKYQVDQTANFAKYHTYQWVEIPGGLHPDQITSNNIIAAFDTTLASKGFTKSTGGQADLYVGYQVAVDQEKQLNFYGGPGWRLGAGMGQATTSTINNGELVFDVYDPTNQSLIWRGVAAKAVTLSNNPQKNQQQLQKAVTKLLQNFPPQKGK